MNNSIHYTPQSTITVTLKRPPMPKWGMRGANHGEGEWGLQGTREPSEAVEAPDGKPGGKRSVGPGGTFRRLMKVAMGLD